MDIEEYAKQSRLSRKVLFWMVTKEMIHNPLRTGDLAGLELMEKVWAKHEIIRAMLSNYPKERRLRLLENSQFKTKWERYAYGRFRNLKPGNRVLMKNLIDEIQTTFCFTLKHHHIKRLYKVREKAYNHKKESKKIAERSNLEDQ